MYLLGVSCTVSSDLSLYYCIKKIQHTETATSYNAVC